MEGAIQNHYALEEGSLKTKRVSLNQSPSFPHDEQRPFWKTKTMTESSACGAPKKHDWSTPIPTSSAGK
ncbi:hypothetical protein CEXT_440531 [Caerostris extrusa]|uniref:Uncharacterized protein n=1 Tax=Caerostris extrusa TaxID=172846 RepID=A0AAV4MQZ4_CAEEX|nr:hypothetical protein CEXT_440531 [Caerostris extrusa]